MLLRSLISRECHAHDVVKFLMAKNVECKFYKYFWLGQFCMEPNLILLNLDRTTKCDMCIQDQFVVLKHFG